MDLLLENEHLLSLILSLALSKHLNALSNICMYYNRLSII